MKFEKLPRFYRVWNSRMQAAYTNKCKREVNLFPLFANQIITEQKSIEKIRAEREADWSNKEKRDRHDHAMHWLEARKALRMLPTKIKERALERYNSPWRPKVPWYLLDAIDQAQREHTNGGELPKMVRLRPKSAQNLLF